jgi:hypothetical protein
MKIEYSYVFKPRDGLHDILGPRAEVLELVEVGTDDFERVVSFDSGEGFHHVVADVLRTIPAHAGELSLQFGIHLSNQLVLGARPLRAVKPAPPTLLLDNGRPISFRAQRHKEL